MIRGVWETFSVFINGVKLDIAESLAVREIGTMFGWGGNGDFSKQLALAILLKYTTPELALMFHIDFWWDVISELPQTHFELSEDSVREWIDKRAKG